MIFRLLFSKQIRKYEIKINNLMTEIKKVNSEKSILLENLNFEKKHSKRIEYLLNHRDLKDARCLIEKTNKGFNVLTAIKDKEYEKKIFDIDNVEYNANNTLVLWAKTFDKHIFIQDIQSGNGNGHGEIAMNHLFVFAKKESKQKIIGNLSIVDFHNKDRLIAFYEKMGFKVNYFANGNGNIEKKITD